VCGLGEVWPWLKEGLFSREEREGREGSTSRPVDPQGRMLCAHMLVDDAVRPFPNRESFAAFAFFA
jgi:hypothetical protein